MGNNNYWGMFGMICLQISAVPSIVQAFNTGETAPLSNIILVIMGLVACMIQEYTLKLWAYFFGSLLGVIGNVGILVALHWR